MSLGLAAAGAHVAIAARSEGPGDVAETFAKGGQELLYIQADLSRPAERSGLIEKVTAHYGRLDILVNNAGHQQHAPVLDYPASLWQLDLEVLLTAVLDLSQQAARPMKAQGGGKIIQIASISSFQGARGIAGYATAKHGLVGLTKCLANELAPLNINVNALAPGIFETDMAAGVLGDAAKSRELKGRVPAGRFGQPEDIVGPLIFLASDASRHVHGHVLLVDGGWMGR